MRTTQKGVTLVELMVALVIGLAIVLAALSLYVNATMNARQSRDHAKNSIESSSAIAEMSRQLRMAGYSMTRLVAARSSLDSRPLEGIPARGCDGGYVDPAAGNSACTGGSGPDAIEIAFEADAFSARKSGAAVLDCAGGEVAMSAVPPGTYVVNGGSEPEGRYLIRNRYYYIAGADGGRLVCVGNGGAIPFVASVVVLTGVEDFQVTYTALRPDGTGVPAKARATELLATFPSEQATWASIQAVHLCLIVASNEARVDVPVPYVKCDGSVVIPADGRARRRYDTSSALRNQVPAGV
jgi:type IV pilus assembly protein PilW